MAHWWPQPSHHGDNLVHHTPPFLDKSMGSSVFPRPWGPEGIPPTAHLLMTVGHTLEGRVNLTNSNKLEKAAHTLWKERAGSLG